jgi:hypothetical protein
MRYPGKMIRRVTVHTMKNSPKQTSQPRCHLIYLNIFAASINTSEKSWIMSTKLPPRIKLHVYEKIIRRIVVKW